jgi:glucuronoarabinoxylan endo-1,4-beta-xylanase
MVGKKDGAYNAKNIVEGGCLDLVFEVKKSHTLTVGSAGYATLFLDYNAAIPENLEAYTVTEVNDGYAKLNLVEGVLPANTGVIVKASADNYSFDASTEKPTAVTGNLLMGSVGDEYVEGAAYVLGILEGNVGLYSAKLNKNATGGDGNTHFLNNAYKAYLPASALTSNANMLRFDFSGETTGVEEVEVESTAKTIYDLSGRKVSSMSAPGLYIVNGKKVLVK